VFRFSALLRLALTIAHSLALAGLFGIAITTAGTAQAREVYNGNNIDSISLVELPPEARHTLNLIQRGGPFPYPHKDGSAFGNFEKRLPRQARGYYREYTVPTPGSRDRGARRLIAGSGRSGDVATSGEYYYTDDHYRSFRRIRQP
jgi:ribonuclease T1